MCNADCRSRSLGRLLLFLMRCGRGRQCYAAPICMGQVALWTITSSHMGYSYHSSHRCTSSDAAVSPPMRVVRRGRSKSARRECSRSWPAIAVVSHFAHQSNPSSPILVLAPVDCLTDCFARARSLLMQIRDHLLFRSLLSELSSLSASDADRASSLITQLISEESKHTSAEEQYLHECYAK